MRTISVSSGKGGVGKTSISINLSILLAQRGHRTAVVDCDFGLANLALAMGLEPRLKLKEVVTKGLPIMEAFTEGPGGVQVLAGASGDPSLVDLEYDALARLAEGFDEIERNFDFLILDNAAGLSAGVLSVSAAADRTLLVVTPDPTSMMDAYATAKLIFKMMPAASVSCVVNCAGSDSEGRAIFDKLSTIARDYLGKQLNYLGCVRQDPKLGLATRRRRPVAAHAPRSRSAQDLGVIADRVSGVPPRISQRRNYITQLLRLRPAEI